MRSVALTLGGENAALTECPANPLASSSTPLAPMGHEKVPAGGHLRSPLVATKVPTCGHEKSPPLTEPST